MVSSTPRGIRNNNPGNLNFVGQRNAKKESGPNGRFAVFNTPENGLRALRDQLKLYYNRDKIRTVNGIISKWAPPTDNNDTSAYAGTVASAVGLGVKETITSFTPDFIARLMHAIIRVENGRDPYGETVEKIARENIGV